MDNRMGTVFVGAVVAGMAVLAVVSIIRDKKAGKSPQCGCDCKQCGGHCH